MPPLSSRHRALGDAIRAARNERGLSQEDLADLAGMSANYVGDTERGERNISIRALWQLADGLSTPLSELMRDAEGRGRAGRRSKSGR